jgi:hypothetical protein
VKNPFLPRIITPAFLGLIALAGGCSEVKNQTHDPVPDMATEEAFDFAWSPPPGPGDGGGGSGGSGGTLTIEPSDPQTLTVTLGQTMPSVQYNAAYNGTPVSVAWTIDRGEVASVVTGPSASTTVAPKGTAGGTVTLTAGFNGAQIKRTIIVNLSGSQNGVDPSNPATQGQIAPSDPTQLNNGGGVGGVGGEGLGGAVGDPATTTALGAPTSDGSAQGLTLLYPYDKTVFPRGMLAPLLMWRWTPGDADAIQISLKNESGSFSWTGQFGRPAILATTGGKFVRHPIPQDVWDAATRSAGGSDKLLVSLVVAKAGVGYGPLTETWTIAAGRLSGIIYYNSYGTKLVQNGSDAAVGGDKKFGGAVLSIHVGDTSPKLAAGNNTPNNNSGCRVCHSVAADGSRLIVQRGDNNYVTSSYYDLTPAGTTEHAPSTNATFPGLTPDGTMALAANGKLIPLPTGAVITPTGLAAVSTGLGTPSFSFDKSKVVFNMTAGPLAGATQKLVVMSFDAATNTFSNNVTVVDNTSSGTGVRPGWPAFLPDGKSVVYHQQTVVGNDGNSDGALHTRSGTKAHIAWTSVADATHVTDLDALNGKGYLPKLPAAVVLTCNADGKVVSTIDADHANDVDLNYEPTVAPVAAGGYVWVVFTSRRMYGNEATIPPFCSDPRGVDLVQNITPKKLWVAAIDLNAAPGSDASHPAFYLPAQELLAGNARAFWALDPCRSDGTSCESGDQCCNGYCQPNGTGGALICSNTPPDTQCSMVSEKCTTPADCCDTANLCINGFCADPIS